PTNVKQSITLNQFLDNCIQGVYDLEGFRPMQLLTNAAGTYMLAREWTDKRRRKYQVVSLLVTDLNQLTSTGDLLVGIVGAGGGRAIIQNSQPTSASQGLAVRLVSAPAAGI